MGCSELSGIKVTAADRHFSLCVRERADWKCQRCRRDFRHEPGKLHCSHVFSRRWASVRHSPLNALALCVGCHRRVSENPIDHVEFFIKINGRESYDLLRELKERIVPKRERPEKEMAKHYKAEHARMVATGSREFVGFI
jgi:cytochrome c553